jgi:ADP-ribose pyrophosphatase YjhB (NUDIX family)
MNLKMIKCTFENDTETSLRHVTADGIIKRGNQILLGKRGFYKGKELSEFGKWALIGGYIDRGETIIEGLAREVLEESGSEIDNIHLFTIIDNPVRPADDRQNISFVMTADFVKTIKEFSEETTEIKWFDIDNLPKKSDIAFDHGDILQLYVESLKSV